MEKAKIRCTKCQSLFSTDAEFDTHLSWCNSSAIKKKTFFDDTFKGFEGLEGITDNGTTHITIETPEGWKCEREGCNTSYCHVHTVYETLKVISNPSN